MTDADVKNKMLVRTARLRGVTIIYQLYLTTLKRPPGADEAGGRAVGLESPWR